MMRTFNPLLTRQVIKALKPRNPVLAALKQNRAPKSEAHRKKRGALRRAENVAVAKAVDTWDF